MKLLSIYFQAGLLGFLENNETKFCDYNDYCLKVPQKDSENIAKICNSKLFPMVIAQHVK